jgi:transposase
MEVSMRNDSTVFVALDVHQKSIVAACAVDAGPVEDLGQIGTLHRDLDRLCQRMKAKGSRVRFVYEAGPCGYAVYRYLTGKGLDCTVCAPSLIARKPGDRVKTDQRDARKLVQALRMGDLSAVHVPDVTDEAFRDLVRVWSAARIDLAKAKQRLKSFLLVHDVRCRHRQLEPGAPTLAGAARLQRDQLTARLSGTLACDRRSHRTVRTHRTPAT